MLALARKVGTVCIFGPYRAVSLLLLVALFCGPGKPVGNLMSFFDLQGDQGGFVEASALRLRAAPSLTADILELMPPGMLLHVEKAEQHGALFAALRNMEIVPRVVRSTTLRRPAA